MKIKRNMPIGVGISIRIAVWDMRSFRFAYNRGSKFGLIKFGPIIINFRVERVPTFAINTED